MHNLRDFRPDLRAAIEQLHRAGFDGEAWVLAAALEGAYSSALEMVQAIAGAVRRIESALGSDVPREVGAAFQRALGEVSRVVAALTDPPALEPSPPTALTEELRPCSSS